MNIKQDNKVKVAIIGGGVNGLTCAAYLAKENKNFAVTVFEKNNQPGGLCVNETPFKSSKVKVSSVASYFGMLRQEVAEELALEKHGLRPYLTDPVEVVLLKNKQYAFYPREGSADMQVEELTEEDRKGWIDFWTDIQKAAEIVYPRYLKPISKAEYKTLLEEAGLAKIAETIYNKSLFDLTDKYFKCPAFKAVAATCTPGFANMPGSVFGCIHHGTASTLGIFGAWGQVKGGMGEVTRAIASAAQEAGAKIITGKAVKKLTTNCETIKNIEFADGSQESFDLIISACDLHTLFEKLLDAEMVPSGILAHLLANKAKVSAAKLHYLLDKKVDFETLAKIGHNHKGVLVIAPDKEAVERASKVVPNSQMPDSLMLTMAYPTLEDEEIYGQETDKTKHVLTVDVHYLPAYLKDEDSPNKERPWQDSDDLALSQAVLETIEGYAPGFKAAVLESYVISPNKLKSAFNNDSLSCWHMPMSGDYLFEERALPTYPHYHTPFDNLYICGAGTYPGGNVTGANGRNLAKLLIQAYKRETIKL